MGDKITDLEGLLAGASHDPARAQELLKQLYAHLRAAAGQKMAAERPGHTLSATALVHEVYLRLAGQRDLPWANRAHFYAAAAEAMERILVDHARARGRHKRGGRRQRVNLEEAATLSTGEEDSESFLALHEALRRLQEEDPRSAQVVRLRYYAGLTNTEAAAVLGVSRRTVLNDWAFAKAWLKRVLRS